MLDALDDALDHEARPPWSVDRQRRSRRTRALILESAHGRIEGVGLERMSVHDLARDVGVSVGALYARFPSKQAILTWLGLGSLVELERMFSWSLGPELPDDAPLAEAVRAFVASLVTHARRHRRILIELRRQEPEPATASLVLRLRERAHAHVRGRLVPALERAGHPEPEAATDFAIFHAEAAVTAGLLTDAPGPMAGGPSTGDETTLVQETTLMLVGYLT
jgi:AcrR family transcriptional regulator